MFALFNYIGLVGTFISAVLLVPALTAFGFNETENGFSLLIYAALGGFLSVNLLVATQDRGTVLKRSTALMLAVFGWVLFPAAIAFPIAGTFGIPYSHALFEAVSALTTTAADGLGSLETRPASAIVLRASLQWTGGLLTILTFLVLLGPTGVGGLPKTRRSIGEGPGRASSGISRMTNSLTRYYVSATLACFALLLMTGVSPFDSLILSATAISSGGYLPPGGQLFELGTPATLLVIAVFFMLASTSVYWHRMVGRWQVDNLRRHRESYYLIAIMLAISIFLMMIFLTTPGMRQAAGTFSLISEAIFNAASLVATSGLQSNAGIFTLLSPAFVFAILLIGGGTYSAAGGLKFYRVGAMLFHARQDLAKLVYPHAVSPRRFGTETYNLQIMKAIWVMCISSIVTIAAGAGLLAVLGLDFQASITASVAAFTNAGPAYSPDWAARGAEGWLAYHEMGIGMKAALAAIMLIGHLEVVVFLVVINPFRWLGR
ncbi:potassium transporter TrkG [Salaquimonas pukyongi]|uniref:potassium transporter TrkG n=1 Tax=Salaquimonas pukyongi TaxID=2712698 RepID=UPI00096B855C|nr:potassium transporter TrkG [Salaquimonas pukyongi]